MDFQTFAKSGRVTECLASEPDLGLYDFPKGVRGFVYPGNVFLEVIDNDANKGFRIEIGSECIESQDSWFIMWCLYCYALEEELLGEVA